ncbi:MAG TPA: methionine--tRNA ligase [Acidimicrobiales bacterium]|nr:methionine--tRNA ligase [Acidimicrobiales bacterium]
MPRYYLTTPIYYVNDVPHIGHAYTSVNADAFARWHRLTGDEVFFLTGTDEHGLKVVRSAEEHSCTPQSWADTTSSRFLETWKMLNISNDDFIRTTEDRHYLAVRSFLERIRERGNIYVGVYQGLYCVPCEAYYSEAELTGGNCPVHDLPVELFTEENYFFALSRFQQELLDFYESHPEAIQPASKRNEAVGFIRQGLEDVSITRNRKSLSWGVQAPWDPDHVIYVWADALVNYLTAIGFGEDEERFEAWWPAVHHILGKDIIRFHGVLWPALCMAAGIEPPASLLVHGWLLVGGEKMSKTRLNQIFPSDLVNDIGVDALRYHLLRDSPFGPDGDFTYESMIERYNADLANNFGNLMSRVATVVEKKCGGIGPAPQPACKLAEVAGETYRAASKAWESYAPNEALEATWRLIKATNAELEASEPWKSDPGPEVDFVMGNALESLRIVAVLASVAMPDACAEVWRRIGLSGSPSDLPVDEAVVWGGYPGGLPVIKGEPIFPRRKI